MEDDRFEKDKTINIRKGQTPGQTEITVTEHNFEPRVIEGVAYTAGVGVHPADTNVLPFPQPVEPKVAESDLKNFYIQMALGRFQKTVAHARMMPAGTIPNEEYEFLKDLGHVLDYVAKLELKVVELSQPVDSQPPESKE